MKRKLRIYQTKSEKLLTDFGVEFQLWLHTMKYKLKRFIKL